MVVLSGAMMDLGNGLANALVCIVMGEVQIWTQPTPGITDYYNYHRKYRTALNGISEIRYFMAPSSSGIVLGVCF